LLDEEAVNHLLSRAFVPVRLPATDGRVVETIGVIDVGRPWSNCFGEFWTFYSVDRPGTDIGIGSVGVNDVRPVQPKKLDRNDRRVLARFLRRGRIRMVA
jgi:hypothetical protein